MSRASEHITMLRGFAWYAFQDQTVSTGTAGEHPFGETLNPAPGMTLAEPPPGVLGAWVISPTRAGLLNRAIGGAYLVLTEKSEPPEVNAGWDIEPARLEPSFQMEQRGDRWLHVSRILGTRPVGQGTVQEVEMEIDRT
jgi:hypothetical protein